MKTRKPVRFDAPAVVRIKAENLSRDHTTYTLAIAKLYKERDALDERIRRDGARLQAIESGLFKAIVSGGHDVGEHVIVWGEVYEIGEETVKYVGPAIDEDDEDDDVESDRDSHRERASEYSQMTHVTA